MMRDWKKYFFNKVCLILILIGLIFIAMALSPLGCLGEFTTNNINSLLISLGTNFIGIWITISFVQYFLDKQNEKDERHQENTTILQYNRVMTILLQHYFRYCFCITTPISERNKYDMDAPNIKFNFCDMCDMYKTTAFTNDNLMKPAIATFYEYDDKIHEYVNKMLENIPFKYNKELSHILLQILEIHIASSDKNPILGNIYNTAGEKILSDIMAESIKNDTENWVEKFDKGQLKSNTMFPYILLYKRLKVEITLFNEYKKYIEQVEKSEI